MSPKDSPSLVELSCVQLVKGMNKNYFSTRTTNSTVHENRNGGPKFSNQEINFIGHAELEEWISKKLS